MVVAKDLRQARMTNWVCNRDGVVFPVGLPRCPNLPCRARDAHEQGDETRANVYDLPEWRSVQLTPTGKDEVGARLGLVPGDPGAEDSSTDPVPVMGEGIAVLADGSMSEVELTGDGIGTPLPDAVEGDNTKRVVDNRALTSDDLEVLEETDEPAGSAPARKRQSKNVPS